MPKGKYPRKIKKPKIYNPYEYSRPHSLRWTGSVIPKVLPSAIVCTLVATTVTCVHELTTVKLSIPQTLIPVLGFVVGLLLTYRTNTAYDRYWEGRRTWSTMVVAIRNLARCIWVNVRETETSHLLEKTTTINLLIGFAVATKHYLREEEGVEWDDLKPYISNIKSRLPGFEPLSSQELGEELHRKSLEEEAAHHIIHMPHRHKMKPHERAKGAPSPVNHNFPLEITLYLSSYIRTSFLRTNIDAPTTTIMLNAVNSLVDCLTSFERILRTPIPLAYSIHLSQTVWVYCLSLPFQLVSLLDWVTIPVVFFASGVLLGIERIGGEIENPFGYDANDLDLDDFCRIIARELETITSHTAPTIEDWVYNKDNRPFGQDGITADEARKLSLDEVRSYISAKEKETDADDAELGLAEKNEDGEDGGKE